MKKLYTFLLVVWIAIAVVDCAQAQTTTTYSGTLKDLTGTAVTSGKVTFDLQPSADTTISGNARFTPRTITCLISGTGTLTATDGVSACVVTNNTALSPAGTSYTISVCPYNTCTSRFNDYALGGTKDISTIVPTPTTSPAYSFASLNANQVWTIRQTFAGGLDGPIGGTTPAAGSFTTVAASTTATASRPVIDVTHPTYGADPTGASSSTAAIQAALNAASEGSPVFVPKGIYKITYTSGACVFTIPHAIELYGNREGTIFKFDAGIPSTVPLFCTQIPTATNWQNGNGSHYHDFMLGNATNDWTTQTAGDQFVFYPNPSNFGPANVEVDHIVANTQQFGGKFINTVSSTSADGVMAYTGHIHGNVFIGEINLESSTADSITIERNAFRHDSSPCVTINSKDGAAQLKVQNNSMTCIGGAVIVKRAAQLKIENNQMEQCGVTTVCGTASTGPNSAIIDIQGPASAISIKGNNFNGHNGATTAIRLDAVSGVEVDDKNVINAVSKGITSTVNTITSCAEDNIYQGVANPVVNAAGSLDRQGVAASCHLPAGTHLGVASYAYGTTPTNGSLITTAIPFQNGIPMQTVHVHGYAYGSGQTIDLTLSFYITGGAFTQAALSSAGGYLPAVQLTNQGGYVAVFLNTHTLYIPQFTVDAYDTSGNNVNSAWYSGWTVTDAAVTGSATVTLSAANTFGTVEATSVKVPSIKSTTGTRYVCVDSSGVLVSQTSACSGT